MKAKVATIVTTLRRWNTFVLGMICMGLGVLSGCLIVLFMRGTFTSGTFIVSLIAGVSLIMSIQGIVTFIWMTYAWEDPQKVEKNKSPKDLHAPLHSFTALIPAREERHVIADTMKAVAAIDYPEKLKEALIICRNDDTETIKEVKSAIASLGKPNIKLVLFDDYPVNKSHSLNVGLKHAAKDIVVVFDAEDEPHRDIYNIVNTILIEQKVDVIQSGIQLMNFHSSWFALMNVLEYFFWFKSSLQFFARCGLMLLAGNTVFFKRSWLTKIGGWDESCLTEDADIGVRLSVAGAKIRVVYDERHVTREETPHTVSGFIQQRSRWIQGFLQVILKGNWLQLPNLLQKILVVYILSWPVFQMLMVVYIPLSALLTLQHRLPIGVALLSNIPLYLLVLQLITLNIGLYEFTQSYRLRYPLLSTIRLFAYFFPFQIILAISACRALWRLTLSEQVWEKTAHINAHRTMSGLNAKKSCFR